VTISSTVVRVAVVDDNPEDRELLVWALEAVDLEPVVIEELTTVEAAVRSIQQSADALVSDHQLRWGQAANFDGAELVARCFEAGIPSILVTAYVMDSDSAIRMHRQKISSLIPRDQVDGDRLRAELEASVAELGDQPPPDRVPRHALVRVLRVREGGSESMVDVVVPQWNPQRNVSFPARMLGVSDAASPLEGRRFLAMVNVGAEHERDLFFADFKDAGEVPEEDELT
jgi:CheY-like chemotaxis protein